MKKFLHLQIILLCLISFGCAMNDSSSTSEAKNNTQTSGERWVAETTRSKKSKRRKRRRRGVTRSCPFGKGPMNNRTCSKKKTQRIAQLLGQKAASCYSRLFVAEAGASCSHTVYHDAKKAKNPHAGVGLCALEKSRAIRQRNRRGPNCMDISTFDKQVICCRDIMNKHGAAYFGTTKCGKAPNCQGLANNGSGATLRRSKNKPSWNNRGGNTSSGVNWAEKMKQSRITQAEQILESAQKRYKKFPTDFNKKALERAHDRLERAKNTKVKPRSNNNKSTYKNER